MATQSLPTIATQAPPSTYLCQAQGQSLGRGKLWSLLMAKGELWRETLAELISRAGRAYHSYKAVTKMAIECVELLLS